MNGNGSYQVTTGQLNQAAEHMDQAASTDESASRQLGSILGQANTSMFGISGQAQAAAANWAKALQARAEDATALRAETSQLGDLLRSAAQQYQDGEKQNQDALGRVGRELHLPHRPHHH